MGIFGFGKKKRADDPQAGADPEASGEGVAERDPRRARRFFEHARAVADSRNYDYAIECYLKGLRHAPESIEHHEAIHEVAIRRRVSGGKPAGMQEKYKYSRGKTPIEKMLNAEFLWAKDPSNAGLAASVMEHAAGADLKTVAHWMGERILEATEASDKSGKELYVRIRDLFAEIGAYGKALEVGRLLVSIDPRDRALVNDLKEIEREQARRAGRLEGGGEEDQPRPAGREEGGDSAFEKDLRRLRSEYEDDPEDTAKLDELVRFLLEREDVETEAEAMRLLAEAHERSGEYRFKTRIGDIRMRQYNRAMRQARRQLTEVRDESRRRPLIERVRKLAGEQVRFELKEYTERVEHDPADLALRYQLGRRQFALGDLDAAIASFREAVSDPQQRGWALRYLGEAFARKDWLDEAIDTLHRGIEVHSHTSDRLAVELRYELMQVMERKAVREKDLDTAREAADYAAQVAGADPRYKDIGQHTDALRKLIEELKTTPQTG